MLVTEKMHRCPLWRHNGLICFTAVCLNEHSLIWWATEKQSEFRITWNLEVRFNAPTRPCLWALCVGSVSFLLRCQTGSQVPSRIPRSPLLLTSSTRSAMKVRLGVRLPPVLRIKMRARLRLSSQEALLLAPRLLVACDCDLCAFGATSAPHRFHTVLSPAAYILSPDEYFGCSLVSSLSLGVTAIRWRWGQGDTHTNTHQCECEFVRSFTHFPHCHWST